MRKKISNSENERTTYILAQSLHDELLGNDLLPVAGVRRVAHHQSEWDVLTAVKGNVGDGGAFARAPFSEKRLKCRGGLLVCGATFNSATFLSCAALTERSPRHR